MPAAIAVVPVAGAKSSSKSSLADNAAVVRLANRLISDHSKSFSDAASLGRSLGVDIPKSPLASQVSGLKRPRMGPARRSATTRARSCRCCACI
jgi:hypothetical protein